MVYLLFVSNAHKFIQSFVLSSVCMHGLVITVRILKDLIRKTYFQPVKTTDKEFGEDRCLCK